MKKLKIKMITGFRKDQAYTIEADEAHKAYFLFLNPEQRGVFNNGVAIIGQDIRHIEPDYHATMGWNSTHIMDGDDWNEVRTLGVERQLRYVLAQAKEIASKRPEMINAPLSEIIQPLIEAKTYSQGLISIGDILKK